MSQQWSRLYVLAVASALLLGLVVPGVANASSPVPAGAQTSAGAADGTHPQVMREDYQRQQSAPLTGYTPATASPPRSLAPRALQEGNSVGGGNSVAFLPSGLQREVFAFTYAGSIDDTVNNPPTFGYRLWDFSLISTVGYFGLGVNGDGSLDHTSTGWRVLQTSQFQRFRDAAHLKGTRVVLTIVLQDFSNRTPTMCSGLANRQRTVDETVAAVVAYGVDGVNVDYEGLGGTCTAGRPQDLLVDMTAKFRAGLPGGRNFLTIDTYGGSAADRSGQGFFLISQLNSYVDAFFVMSYDMEYSNYGYPPLNCSRFCLGPTAPLTGYHYNETGEMADYLAVVPANKVILGTPYYGRKGCVDAPTANATLKLDSSGRAIDISADRYVDALYDAYQNPYPPVIHHFDANDPPGHGRWETWYSPFYACARELYWDDATALNLKYDLVNRDQLRGVGLWTVNYTESSDLWNSLRSYFATTPATAVLSAASLSFGGQGLNIQSGALTLTVTNTGDLPLTINAITIDGDNASDFAKATAAGAPCATSLAARASCNQNVTFTPSALGSRTARLIFNDNAAGSPQTVTLGGVGLPVRAVLPAMANVAYGGYSTRAYIRNLGSAPARVNVTYRNSDGQSVGAGNGIPALLPNALWEVRQDDAQGLAAGQSGNAVVSSDQPLATIVNEGPPGGFAANLDAGSYAGIDVATPATSLLMPAIAHNAYGGYTTGISLVNFDRQTTTLTITYTGYNTITREPLTSTQTITNVAGGGHQGIYSGSFGQPTDANLPDFFAGTATVTSTPPVKIAAVVNETGPGGQFSSYAAIARPTRTVYLPTVLNQAYGGYSTGIAVQNAAAAEAHLQITYYNGAGGMVKSVNATVPSRGYLGAYTGDAILGAPPSGEGYTAKVTSDVDIAVIVNETGANVLTAYNGFQVAGPSRISLPLVENGGPDPWNTALGIMNTSTAEVVVTIDYHNESTGAPVGTRQSRTLQPNAFWGAYSPASGLPAGRATATVSAAGGTVAVICNEAGPGILMSYNGQ